MEKRRIAAALCLPCGAIFLAALLLVQPPPAQATIITATICSGPLATTDFTCTAPGNVVVDSGIRNNFVPLQLGNTYSISPFAFSDAFMTFSGTIMTTDILGRYIYSWASGVATAGALGVGDTMDVTISQNYVTVPGLWGFSEFDNGTCNGNAIAAGSTSLVQGAVTSLGATNLLPVLGAAGDCRAAPFALGAGPFPQAPRANNQYDCRGAILIRFG